MVQQYSRSSFKDVLRTRALERAERSVFTFLRDGEEASEALTYAELDLRARVIAARLQAAAAPGERALLLYPPGLEFIAAFCGCVYSGVLAVPTPPPRPNRPDSRLQSIVADSAPRIVLTTGSLLARAERIREQVPALRDALWIASDELDSLEADDWREPALGPETPAFLQYTSGSTSTPKGVLVSHGNLLHNQESIRRAFGQDESSVVVGWLPLYHDMGLIGNVLQPLYAGASCVLMSPQAFLQRPARWLEAISRYRATTSGGPNFAYDLCVRAGLDLTSLDLGSWRVAFNGAEPVRAETLERFAAAFAPAGFRADAFYPCYGLAEATLFVAGAAPGRAPAVRAFDKGALERDLAVPVSESSGDAPGRRLVGCGSTWLDHQVAIVRAETGDRCADGEVGEIWMAGPSVAAGYWNRPAESAETFGARLAGAGPWLRTGDLGFVDGGELFVSGRLKDLVIIRGRNHYPQDIERTAELSHPGLRAGGTAAFSVDAGGEERLVVVQEVERHHGAEAEALSEAVRRAVAEEHEVQVYEVVLLRPGSLPKTSSGKVRRQACRAGYLAETLAVVGRSALDHSPLAGTVEAGASLRTREELLALPAAERRAAVLSFLEERAAALLGRRPEPGQPLTGLGLDSLRAVELKTVIESALATPVPLAELLEGCGTGELADRIAAALAGAPAAEEELAAASRPLPTWPAAPEAGDHPLSMGQRSLWLLDRLAPQEAVYNIAVAARTETDLHAEALLAALLRLAERHGALRATFHEVDGEVVQRIRERPAVDFQVVDAAGWSDRSLAERLGHEAWRPFDLTAGPLLRLRLFNRPAGPSVLLLAVHHIVADFGSLAVMSRELGALYRQETGGPAAALPPLALRYADYVRWQEERLASPRGWILWDYWRDRLAGPPPDLDLPTDRLRPPVQSYRGGARALGLPRALAEGARSLARGSQERGGATLFATLLALWQAQLGRYAGQEDFTVGSPMAGRGAPELQGLVGYFVNPVALRAGLAGEPTVAELVARAGRTAVEALEHSDWPFALLVERLRPVRDPARPPLFQVMLVMQGALPGLPGDDAGLPAFALGEAGARLALGGVALESVRLEERRAQVDLLLRVAETGDGLGLSLEFNTDLFDGPTADRMLGHFRTLLEGAVAEPGRRASSLPLLTAGERAQAVTGWNDTVGPASESCLHELFEAQVRRAPEAEALVAGEERLTYGELNARANRLARHLRRLGVGPETRVGVGLERSADLVVALLAVLKAGGAYVPLDPSYPAERLAFLAADSGARLLITRGSLLTGLPVLDLDRETFAAQRAEDLEPWAAPDNLAYLIYTSGSTGRPKAVAIEHRSAAALLGWAREVFTPGELAGVLASTSVSFDLSVFELFAPLAWGGRVILARDALALPSLPARDEVTLVNTVPSAMAELLRGWALPPSFTVNLAGEPIPAALAAELGRHPAVRRAFNLYGPSEDTTYSTWARLEREEPNGAPIGRPVAGTRAYVVDRGGELLPAGVPGELCLGGAGLARGYLGRPELTAERFVPDPFSGLPGARLYRTGDLVRRRPDGVLEFLGRFDHQVKVRGFRIELGEIETALASHPAVREAAVLAQEDEAGGRRLVAYLALAPGARVAPGELRDALRQRLPEAMVPAAFVTLEALPRNANGKLDRRALPRPEGLQTATERSYTAPRNPVEEALAGIWADVLGSEQRIGADDDFFELGGHSLLATRVISRVREAFGVELPMRALFEATTLAALAARIELATTGAAPAPIPRASRPPGGLPLSFAQQRLWFLDRLAPDNPFYNIFTTVRLTGPLDVAALEQAFAGLVRRHESLRTTFRAEAGRPVQVIGDGSFLTLPRLDLGSLAVDARQAEARRLAHEESQRPFDLATDPLLRVRLLRLGDAEHTLLVNVHHIVADGWSMGVLRREITALYEAAASGKPVSAALPELPVQYADFAIWQRDWLRGEVFLRQLDYWKGQLAGMPGSLPLPYDRPRPLVETFRGRRQTFRLPAGLLRGLTALTRRRGATPSMTLLAGFQALLGRIAGTDDLAIGVAIANRTRREIEGLIGFFVNTLVLRARLGSPIGDGGFSGLIDQVREASLSAYAHQDLPFERLVEELQPERDASRNPLIQVMFGYQNFPRSEAEVRGLTLVPEQEEVGDRGTAKFDLTLFLLERDDELAGALEYNSDLFDAATIRRLTDRFEALLAAALAAPQRPLTLLPLLAAAEEQQLVVEWNATAASYPAGAGLPELFAAQARQRPDSLAVLYGDHGLSFAELDRRSDRLARRLAASGVGLESRVGLCLERSPELIVGMLGILKAGGAYVPLDPDYPAERLALLIEDAGVVAVVTTARAEAGIPARGLPVLRLDEEGRDGDGKGKGSVLPVAPDGANLAYVIYTSGSTGRPKGVEVTHRAVSRLVLNTDYVRLGPADRVAQAATASFDAATYEIWGPLLHGGCVVGITKETLLDPGALADALRRHGVTSLFVTTALFHQVARESPTAFATLDSLLFGGEAIDPRRVREVLAGGPPRRLLHVYGPTESTTFATWQKVTEVPEGATTAPIGGPIANTRLFVLDPLHQPVPLGVAGELCLAGDGLARGYTSRPALTAAKWIPDPFGAPFGKSGERLYRTGDLVRLRPDGAVEFMGRIDSQVKVRGFRIEPGEIEACLAEHTAVQEAVVVAREDAPGERRLVAYVVGDADYAPANDPAERPGYVAQWESLFDDIYRRGANETDPTFNIVGWDSTYTGQPLPREEMVEWLDDTVERIRSLAPRRVLELGCGTGMLLFRLARPAEIYVGTDISRRVLDEVEAHLATWPERPPVELQQRRADELSGFAPGSFDTVILNSVVQYFPSADYLAEVIAGAVTLVRPGGSIFIGDLRSLPLLDAFHTSVELERAEADLPLDRLRQRIQVRRLHENELVVAPELFAALEQTLPGVGRVEIHPKRGRAHNELTGYRYQVVLRVGESGQGPAEIPAEIPWLDWQREGLTPSELRRLLEKRTPEVLGLANIPNARVAAAAAAARLLAGGSEEVATAGELRQRAAAAAATAVDPQDFWELLRHLPYEVELGWAAPGADGRFEAVLRRAGRGATAPRLPLSALLPPPRNAAVPLAWSHYANNPMQGRFARSMAPELRAFLAGRLPDYMVPSIFVPLDALPLSPTGKVDRRRLPAPELSRREGAAFVAPRTPVERELARIFAELLGMERIGAGDNFFELGGHSLLATQAVSRAREAFRVEVPLRALFQAPTVAGLAERIEAERRAGTGLAAPPIVPVPRQGLENGLPLSFAQQRLWFIDQMEPGSSLYNVATALRMTGRLDLAALAGSFGEIARRHESLRTVFGEVEGVPVQRVLPPAAVLPKVVVPPVVDLAGLDPGRREGAALALAAAEAQRPFDLARGPLFRLGLLRLSGEEHVLLLTLHHVISDGWSMGVLVREVAALYPALLAGGPSPLPELPVQYADFAVWQRHWLRGEVLERELAYWKGHLAGAPPVLALPADRPRPAVQSFRGALRPLWLPEALLEELRALGLRRDATLFMTLLAAFQTLLARYSGQWDVSVGTPIAGRNRHEIEGLIGFFVNTLVLRTDLSGDPGFDDLLDRVREVSLAAQTHQEVPFEKLVEELEPVRSLSYAPLFQVMLALQNAPVGALELPGLTLSPLPDDGRTTAKFDLTLFLDERAGGLGGALEYSRDLFEAPTAERMLGHFRALLQGVAAAPAARLSELPLLSPAERQALLLEWNATGGPAPAGAWMERLRRQAARTPQAVAVAAPDEELTYGELAARVRRLAGHLRSLGIGPGDRVGVWGERSVAAVVGLLGALEAGAAYVPLDPSHPAERLAFLIQDSGIRALLARDRGDGLPPIAHLQVIDPDAGDGPVAAADPASAQAPEPADLAYVIYTSGSTGLPKGVMVSHGGLGNYLDWAVEAYAGGAACSAPLHSSLGFDLTVTSLFIPLLTGGTLHLLPEQEGVEALATALRRRSFPLLKITPAHLQVLSHLLADADLSAHRGTVVVGGEALLDEHVAWWRDRAPGLVLVNEYGPTETVVGCCVYTVPMFGAAGAEPGSVPIGRPIARTRLYVLDRDRRPLPSGVPGELFIGGAGVARGYLRRPDLTADRFIPAPFAGDPGERLYRTGDLARYLPGGDLEYLGRTDQQVKIRGFRVEPGEVEAVLAGHPAVRDCAVLARRDAQGASRLVAYVAGDDLRPPELRSYLERRLPQYMVPSAFVALAALPLTVHGKVDRLALPAEPAERTDPTDPTDRSDPADPVSELLAGIWAEVLGRDRIGVHDDFFALGGHSLLATQVVSRIRGVLGVDLSLRELFESPTVAKLAAAVRSAQGQEVAPILAVPRHGELPLSFPQQRLWFLDQLEPGKAIFNQPSATRLTGELSPPLLARVFTEIVRRHESLRTTFESREGRPVQIVGPALPAELPVMDLAGLPPVEREAEARRLAAAEAGRPFDLRCGPVLRLGLLRLAERDHLLLMTLHHIASDAWSVALLVHEVAALYGAFADRRPSPLPELPLQYGDFAVWQRNRLQGAVLEEQLAYWREKLAGAQTVLDLPTDRPRPALQAGHGASLMFELAGAPADAVLSLSRRCKVTPYMASLAAFQIVLQRYAGQDDFLVGSTIAGRDRQELEALIGFFVNTLLLRTGLRGDPSGEELLERVRETALGAFTHQELPFERLIEELKVERDLSRSPGFQVVFAFQNVPLPRVSSLPGLLMEPLAGGAPTAKYDLELTLAQVDGRLAGDLLYSTALFDDATARRLLSQYRVVLAALAERARSPIGELPWLTPAEAHQLRTEWTEVLPAPLPASSIPAAFEEWAERTPQALALVCSTEERTYRDLNREANRLARRLLRLGAGAGVRVGICVERSVEMVVGLLAILKTGAAYVPLDPTYPAERLAYMLGDSGAPLLLARGAWPGGEPVAGVTLVDLDGLELAGADEEDLEIEIPSESPAYVIYTSGSTGRPKGVLVTHANVLRLFASTRELFGFGSTDVWTLFHSYAFDFSVWEIWGALLHGGRLVVVPFAVSRSPEKFHALLRQEEVTVLNQTPSAFQQLVWAESEMRQREGSAPRLPRLRWVIFGGEALDLARLAPWIEHHGDRRPELVNMYGITETTVHVTQRRILREDLSAGGSLIGRPLPDLSVHLVSRGGGLAPIGVPIGVPGEIWVGGAGLGTGYLGRPGLTAERFVPDPFGAEAGGRLYRSGDLARHLPNGGLQYLGRIDHQVKVRGFRIELGEIESVLRRHPGVRDVAVLVRPGALGEASLAAFVAAEPAALTGAELRDLLARHLPDYMVPAAVVVLDELPLTSNGKVDRQALLRLEPAPQEAAAVPVAPRTPDEELMAGLWAQVLGVEQVGLDDNFFDLGGHSLLATRLIARVREIWQAEVSLVDLFQGPTVAGLLARLQALAGGARDLLPPIERGPAGEDAPLSFTQQRLWFLDRLEPGNSAFHIPVVLRATGPLHVAALERSFQELARRQEILRTTFPDVEGRPRQVVSPPAGPALPLVDLSALPEPRRASETRRVAAAEARRAFDLPAGPLWRLALLRLAAEEHVLLLVMHHIISDAWSMGILVREAVAFYSRFAEGKSCDLPPLPVQYADFSVWQRRHLTGATLETLLGYWKQRLGRPPAPLELPADGPRPAVPSYRGAHHPFRLSPELSSSLRELSRREGVTLFMTFLAAFQVLLHRLSGRGDFVVGVDIANRNRAEIAGLIGFFVNQIAVRSNLSGEPTFRELLARVREDMLGAYAHQDLPFDRLVDALQPERSLGHIPIFQVLLSFENTPKVTLAADRLVFALDDLDPGTAKRDLTLFVREDGASCAGSWNYSTDLFAPATIQRMAGQLEVLLGDIVAHPDARISSLEMRSEEERRRQDVEKLDRKDAKFANFLSVKPRAVGTAGKDLVRKQGLRDGQSLPLLITPALDGVDLTAWVRAHREELESHLSRHGGVLFRGFDVKSVAEFEQFALAVCDPLFGDYGDLPPEENGRKVYQSTPYPADKAILFHNEGSHTHRWPLKQFFFCLQAAQQGGETPIVDCRAMYNRLDSRLIDRLSRKQLLYVRNFTDGLDVSWQEFFKTEDRAEVERYCQRAAIDFEWKENGLRTRHLSPAVVRHPKNGEMVFFNQVQLHHIACLEPAVRESLLEMYGEEDLPRNVYYGDGSPIEDSVMEEISRAYQETAVSFPWQEGDIILLDNMLIAHGRNPFVGPRRIVVAMGEMIEAPAVRG